MKKLLRTHLNTDWQFIETSREKRGEWLPAIVPSHVHVDLVREGVIGDPFYRMNELGCQWVDAAAWSYKRSFEWQPTDGLSNRILRFEGLDTVCTVTLNGTEIAKHDNMHVPLEVDVTKLLKKGTNDLRVDFQPAAAVGEERKAAYLAEQGLPADAGSFPERSFVRKAQYMFGWDWGPRLVSCGIWKPVSLIEFASRITNVWAWSEPGKIGSFIVHVKSEIEGKGRVSHVLVDADGVEIGRRTGNGDIVVKRPELWWTHDLGEPYLYTLGSFLEHDGELVDSIEDTKIGLRTIELIQEDDEFGTSFQFALNGVPIWARGANWIPDHSFPSQVDGLRYRTQIERAVNMNMNMLRVWGGGLYESDAFYNVADELGILIWQDCAYGCSFVPDTGNWLDVARTETESNVKRLRNHPSLAHWCGNNENLMAWDYSWGGGPDKRGPRFYGENIYNDVIPGVLAKLDPKRPYTPSSPWGGEKCNDDRIGDQHNWSVWHGGDWPKYTDSKARFCSEFGFACSPSTAVWDKWIAPEDAGHGSPVVRWHDKTGKGYETFQGYVKNHYPEATSLEEWTYYSQLNQRDALRHGIEHYRRSEFCKGTLIWQINDCWPVQSWALIDCLGRWKAAAFELPRVYKDDLVTISREGSTVRVHAVNDGGDYDREDETVYLAAIHTMTGEILHRWDAEVSLEAGERKLALEADVAGLPTAETLLVATWGEGCYAWKLLGEPKDAKLPVPEILCRVSEDGRLEVRSDLPVIDLMLTAGNGKDVFIENFVTIPSGGSALVDVSADFEMAGLTARSLAGAHKVRIVNGPI